MSTTSPAAKKTEVAAALARATVEQLRAELARRVRDDVDALNLTPRGRAGGTEECATGRFWGVFTHDGFNEPIALFASQEDAADWLKECQSLDSDDDRWLSQDHCICRVDAIYSTWNSTDPDPFEPLPEIPPYAIRTKHDAVRAMKREA